MPIASYAAPAGQCNPAKEESRAADEATPSLYLDIRHPGIGDACVAVYDAYDGMYDGFDTIQDGLAIARRLLTATQGLIASLEAAAEAGATP